MLESVEVAAMSVLVMAMGSEGRTFLPDFYPVSVFYIALRWGPEVSNRVTYTPMFLILTTIGLLFTVRYAINTELRAMILVRALW